MVLFRLRNVTKFNVLRFPRLQYVWYLRALKPIVVIGVHLFIYHIFVVYFYFLHVIYFQFYCFLGNGRANLNRYGSNRINYSTIYNYSQSCTF